MHGRVIQRLAAREQWQPPGEVPEPGTPLEEPVLPGESEPGAPQEQPPPEQVPETEPPPGV